MKLRMETMDKFWLSASIALMVAAPFVADAVMPPARAEEPAAVQLVDKHKDSPTELWSFDSVHAPDYSYIPMEDNLIDELVNCCLENEVPLELALSVIEQESGFDPYAIGPDGKDIGLFQIRKSNHAWLQAETGADPMEPEGNIQCGVWLLGYLLRRYDTAYSALTAYRYGDGSGDQGYAKTILKNAEKWSKK